MKCPPLAIIAAVAALLVGCASHSADPPPQTAAPPPMQATPAALTSDAPANISKLIDVVVYWFYLPYGAVTNNPEFWQRIDEHVLDVPTYDRLYRNGLRIGRGRLADYSNVRAVLDRENNFYNTIRFSGPSVFGDPRQPDIYPKVAREDLWVLDEHGWEGKTFENCENQFQFSFQWAPRLKDTVRVSACPVVYLIRPPPSPVAEALGDVPSTESFYDLGLRVDIPPDQFLVIAPSPATSDLKRVGSLFLTTDTPASRFECVLILVQQSMPITQARFGVGPAVPASAPTTAPARVAARP